MGKISNNLITEKALRATRVNKAIENFIKANGGKFTIMYPDSNPEHIAYTASITSPSDYSRNGNVGVSRKVRKYIPGKGPRIYTNTMFNKEASRYVANALNKATGHDKEMSKEHFKEPSTESTSNSTVKNSVWNKLKNSKAGNWLKNTKAGTKASNWLKNAEAAGNWLRNTKVGGYFTDSPLTPQNVALTYKPQGELTIKGWRVGWNPSGPAAYQLMQGMGVSGGYMPLPGGPEENRDRLRFEFGQDELSDIDTVVKMNPQGTIYLDPKLGIQPTEVLEDYEGNRFYRNAQTGQFEPLDYNPQYSTYVPLPRVKKVYPTDSNGVPYLNDILGGVLSMPKSDTPLPIPPMQEPYNYSAVPENQTSFPESYSKMDSTSNGGTNKQLAPILEDAGRVSLGSTTASTNARGKPTVNSVVKSPRKAIKPRVVNNTPVTPVVNTPTPTSNVPTSNVAAPTLSSVVPQAVRHNGGFDDYRRQSVLSALRAAGGISPAEAVQRGIIPWEALNYV